MVAPVRGDDRRRGRFADGNRFWVPEAWSVLVWSAASQVAFCGWSGLIQGSGSSTRVSCKAEGGILATTAGATSGVHEFFHGKPLRVTDLREILHLQANNQ